MKTHSEIMYTDIYILTNLDVVYALMFLLIDVFGGPEKGLLCWMANACLSLGLLGLLGEEDGLDVGQDTSLGDGDTGQELVQLLVVTDGELKVTGDDPGLLVVTSGVAGQLEDLSGEVLHDGGHVDGGTGSDTLGIVTLPQETVDTSHGELKSSTAGPGLCLSLDFAALASSGHVDCLVGSEKLIAGGRGCEILYSLLGARRHAVYIHRTVGRFSRETLAQRQGRNLARPRYLCVCVCVCVCVSGAV